ncbi:MAG: response regulator [Chryseobacterium sp.]|uniref:response regulator n=1 Tax=Chryseobacterium sp. TaxID=1871047 RepID=UPI0025BD7928|nr:response regulator [Chryseobacterium sp.]MCJ7936263.1 response regulator [Chryseobacterium sp.]
MPNSTKIFIVEDDLFFGEMLKYHMALNPDHEIFLFDSAKDCLSNLYLNPDIICTDFGLPDMKGDVLFKKIKESRPSIPVIIISGQEDIETAINFLKAGAHDYIVKNEHTKEILWNSILKLKENISLKNEVEVLKGELEKNTLLKKV